MAKIMTGLGKMGDCTVKVCMLLRFPTSILLRATLHQELHGAHKLLGTWMMVITFNQVGSFSMIKNTLEPSEPSRLEPCEPSTLEVSDAWLKPWNLAS